MKKLYIPDLKKLNFSNIKLNIPRKSKFDFKKLGKHDLIYIGWTAAIFLCVALSVFAFMFASCSKAGAEPNNNPESPSIVSPVL